MLRRTIALFTLICTFQVFATAPAVNFQSALKTAYNDLQFSLEVEWDQQDRAQYKSHMDSFRKKVTELQKQGLTNAEMIEFVRRNIKDEARANDLTSLITQIETSNMAPEQATELLTGFMKETYQEGASWTGYYDGYYLLVGALLVLLVIAAAAGGSSSGSSGSSCYDEYVCYDYYDSWGYYMYTDCGYQTYCY